MIRDRSYIFICSPLLHFLLPARMRDCEVESRSTRHLKKPRLITLSAKLKKFGFLELQFFFSISVWHPSSYLPLATCLISFISSILIAFFPSISTNRFFSVFSILYSLCALEQQRHVMLIGVQCKGTLNLTSRCIMHGANKRTHAR